MLYSKIACIRQQHIEYDFFFLWCWSDISFFFYLNVNCTLRAEKTDYLSKLCIKRYWLEKCKKWCDINNSTKGVPQYPTRLGLDHRRELVTEQCSWEMSLVCRDINGPTIIIIIFTRDDSLKFFVKTMQTQTVNGNFWDPFFQKAFVEGQQ